MGGQSFNPDGEDQGLSSEFLMFCSNCESVGATRSKLAKTRIIADYLRKLDADEDLGIATTFLSGRVFRLGAESQEPNVGYSLIWKTVTSSHGLSDKELSEYYLRYGDLGSAIEDYLSSDKNARQSTGSLLFNSQLTLKVIYSAFQELARSSGKGSRDRRQRILERLFSSVRDPVEAKYIVRILASEMRIGLVEGLLEESIAKAFSKTLAQVRSAHLVSADLGYVAILAKHDKLLEAKIQLFHPTNFMLADSAQSAEDLYARFEEMPVLSEYKYDGIRAQIHTTNGTTKIFSRNLEDITRFFPEIEVSTKAVEFEQTILDGEIVAFQDGKPLAFQALQQRLRKLKSSEADCSIKYFAFDFLFYKRPLIEEKLSTRVRLLHSLNLHDVLAFSEQRLLSSADEIALMFEESKSLGYEGLVVKSPSSQYTPGKRGKNWVKLKRELDTLDVVVIAAEYGHGKRAGLISDYTFAVKDGDALKVIGKAYSGLTDPEILEMTKLLKEITLRDYGHRMSIKPQVVLEVAFDAIQKSGRHDSGYALRFPRIKRIRRDKSVLEIDTIEKVKQIYVEQKVKF